MSDKVETYKEQQARNAAIHRRDNVLRHLGVMWRKAFGAHTPIERGSADAMFLEFATDLVCELRAELAKQARTAKRAQVLAVLALLMCVAFALVDVVRAS